MSSPNCRELTVVMPVYNEQDIIGTVIESWIRTLCAIRVNFELIVLNDGSKDNTLIRLIELGEKYGELKIIDKKNSGHGSTILQGYRMALSPWVFQVDSDNEMEAEHFPALWEIREGYDLIIGTRMDRTNAMPRRIISWISRKTILVFYGRTIRDVNSPYRLYRRERFAEAFNILPPDTFAPNVILSGLAGVMKLRMVELNVPCRPRATGEVSIKRWKLLKAAAKSFQQTVKFRLTIKKKDWENVGS